MNETEIKKPPIGHAQRNTPIYDMIRFWGRKPNNLVRMYIEHYTDKNDVVLDPFAGCGVAAIEALKSRRRAIYNDLNKYCKFIARISSQPVDIEKLKNAFKELVKKIEKKKYPVEIKGKDGEVSFDWLYSTKCPKCSSKKEMARILGVVFTRTYRIKKRPEIKSLGKSELPPELASDKSKMGKIASKVYEIIKIEGEISDQDLGKKIKLKVRPEDITRSVNEKLVDEGLIEITRELPILIEYKCLNSNCKAKDTKVPSIEDINKIDSINEMTPEYYYPTQELSYNDKKFLTLRPGTETMLKLFTRRNLIALSILKHEIEGLEVEDEIKENLLLCFAAILEHVCKMERPNKKGWGVKNYIIHPTFLEQNVIHVFKNRFKTILDGKEEANNEIGDFYKESSDPKEVINNKANVCFLDLDARKLPIDDNKVDYVFTDPEYGPSIQYYELSFMASTWLGFKNDWKNEIVVNPKQEKTAEVYRDMLCTAFGKIFKILKPGGYMTVTFHSREIKYWNALMYAIQLAGFEYVDAVYEIPQIEYTNWLYARNPGEMRGDVYITFYKPEISKGHKKVGIIELNETVQNDVLPEAREIILLHNGEATLNQLVRGITLKLIKIGVLHDPKIRDLNYSKIFDEHLERVGHREIWKLKEEKKVSPIDYIPLDRRIGWLIYSVFNRRKGKATVDDILSAIYIILKNAKTPENREIMNVLRSLAEPRTEEAKPYWIFKEFIQADITQFAPEKPIRPKLIEIEKEEELDHVRVITLVAKLGKYFGYDVFVGNPEVRKTPDLKKYRTVDWLRVYGPGLKALDRLMNVDVIWLENKTKPIALIEVEHSTDPRQGLLRMSNIFAEIPLEVKIFSIIPDKREGKLREIIDEPSIKKLIGERVVHCITYSSLAQLVDEIEYKKINFADFVRKSKALEAFNI